MIRAILMRFLLYCRRRLRTQSRRLFGREWTAAQWSKRCLTSTKQTVGTKGKKRRMPWTVNDKAKAPRRAIKG